MTPHARISPSALRPTSLCPPRVRVNQHARREQTIFSAEGTLLHDIMADCIEQDFEPADFIGQVRKVDGFEIAVDAEMADCMMDALDWVREQPGKVYVERQVFLDPWMPGMFGFVDLVIVNYDHTFGKITLSVIDWKFGVGKVVPILNNYQLRAYALGFIQTFIGTDILPRVPDEINLIIEQPRAFGKAPRFYEPWTLTYEELLPFGDEMAEIMRRADDPTEPRVAGPDQCSDCSAGFPGGCAAYDAFHLDLLGITIPAFDPEKSEIMVPELRAALVRNQSMITGWLKEIAAQSLEAAINGNPPPGLKAIDGDQGDREWGAAAPIVEALMVTGEYIDPETGEIFETEVLGPDKSFTRKVLSPAQIEKLAKPTRTKPGLPKLWNELQSRISRKPSKPQLVLASDPRPAIAQFDDEFDDLPET